MKRTCDKCIHQAVCIEDAITSGIPFCNPDTCGFYKEISQKELPKKVKWLMRSNKNAGGYCPQCGQGVQIKNTFAIKHRLKKGHYCEWCSQQLDWGNDPFKETHFFFKLKEDIKWMWDNAQANLILNILLILLHTTLIICCIILIT